MNPSEDSSASPSDPPPSGQDGSTYRELFERSPDAILIIEGDQFVDCNDATVRMLGYESKEQVLATHPSELSPPTQPDGRDSFEKANEKIALAQQLGSLRFEWDHVRADGSVFPVEVLLTAVTREGRPILHVGWRDISERKHLEEQLRHALKMEAIGKLAGGIAHDFNNLLVAIQGNAELLAEYVAESTVEAELVDEVSHAAGRAAELTAQLLAFSRRQHLEPTVVDLNQVVVGLETMLARLLGEQVELVLDLDPGKVTVLVDAGQIEQVLVNLVANARDATRSGGLVTIETALVELDDEPIGVDGTCWSGSYVLLSVADTGVGMTPDVLERAVDPFFTTKKVGEGTGLGLSTVYGILRQSQGDVILRSEPGLGTTVSALLPLHTGVPVDKPKPTGGAGLELPEPALDGSELVLLVEDEPAVSHLMARALRSRGYKVVSCSDGAQAVELFRGRVSEIDVIVSDVVMPGLTGPAMVRALAEGGSLPPVLLVSGYTRNALSHMEDLGPLADFMQKPFTATEFLERVRGVLDRARTA